MAAVETAMSMSDRSKARRGAFFGRRKGHALRPRQAELFDTLLPRLAIELAKPAPPDLGLLFPNPVDSIRLEIGFGGGEPTQKEGTGLCLVVSHRPGQRHTFPGRLPGLIQLHLIELLPTDV